MTFTEANFEAAQSYALQRLERELSPDLHYHSLQHTRDDVLPGVERLSKALGIEGEALLMLRTAAVFHDIGYIQQHHNHEIISANIAREQLPHCGYTGAQIEQITALIMATRVPQTPHNLAEQIIADADLDVLGREDFWQRNVDLRTELATLSAPVSDEQWYQGQVKFMEAHSYFTSAARSLRNARKQQHLEQIKKMLAEMQR